MAQRTPGRSSLIVALACCVAVVAALAAELKRWPGEAKAARAPALIEIAEHRNTAFTMLSDSHIPMPPGVPSAHASSLAAIPGDEMLAFWWAGSRESGPDVKIYASRWTDGGWTPPYEVASRSSLGAALGFGIRRIGNPVAWTARDGKINLFVVATGLGSGPRCTPCLFRSWREFQSQARAADVTLVQHQRAGSNHARRTG